MSITPTKGFPTAGLAAKYQDTINPAEVSFLAGDYPPALDRTHLVLAGQEIAALTVVGLDGDGKVVPAVLGTTAAVGVLVYDIDTTASGTNADTEAQVYRTGNFNPDELVWDSSYGTDAEKAAAFDAAPAPTHIFVTKTETFAV